MIISHTTERFRKAIAKLPENVRKQARNAYRQFREDPYHPSLHFKKVHEEKPVYSARISDNYRAVGIKEGNTVIWFWAQVCILIMKNCCTVYKSLTRQ